jgi:hypothetical protein
MKYAVISEKTNRNDNTVALISLGSTFVNALIIRDIGPLFSLVMGQGTSDQLFRGCGADESLEEQRLPQKYADRLLKWSVGVELPGRGLECRGLPQGYRFRMNSVGKRLSGFQ